MKKEKNNLTTVIRTSLAYGYTKKSGYPILSIINENGFPTFLMDSNGVFGILLTFSI